MCSLYSHVPSTERRKLDKKAQRMCFIGYSKNPKRYRLIDLSTDKVVTKRVVVFNETDFRFSNEQMMKVGQVHLKMRHLKVNLNQKNKLL